jgi:hypothetical protein
VLGLAQTFSLYAHVNNQFTDSGTATNDIITSIKVVDLNQDGLDDVASLPNAYIYSQKTP